VLEVFSIPYLYLYLLGYRININAWPSHIDFDRTKAVALISLIFGVFFLILSRILFRFTGYRDQISPFYILTLTSIIFSLNYYVLVIKKAGPKFIKTFDNFGPAQRKKIITIAYSFYALFLLLLVCLIVLERTIGAAR